jgi:hypothetical protein
MDILSPIIEANQHLCATYAKQAYLVIFLEFSMEYEERH